MLRVVKHWNSLFGDGLDCPIAVCLWFVSLWQHKCHIKDSLRQQNFASDGCSEIPILLVTHLQMLGWAMAITNIMSYGSVVTPNVTASVTRENVVQSLHRRDPCKH